MDDPAFYFNETPVNRTPCQKHLGMHLNERLNFKVGLPPSKKIGLFGSLKAF